MCTRSFRRSMSGRRLAWTSRNRREAFARKCLRDALDYGSVEAWQRAEIERYRREYEDGDP